MNSRERVIAALEHRKPDMIPYTGGFSTTDAAMAFLGPKVTSADWLEGTVFQARLFHSDIVGVPALIDAFYETISSDENYSIDRTPFGGIWFERKKPYFRIPLHNPIQRKEDLDKLERIDVERFRPKVRRLAEKVRRLSDLGYFVMAACIGPVETDWYFLRGMENFWVDTIEDPEFVHRSIEFALQPSIRLMEMVIDEAPIDGVFIGDDIALGDRLYFSVDTYRRLIKPWYQEMNRRLHKKGVKVIYHSHGNITELFDELVQIGFDAINPLDPSDYIDLADVKRKYGDKVALYGGISKHIGRMSKKEIREHIRDRIQTGGPEGFILGNAGGIPLEMPIENFNYYIEVVEEERRRI
ncbi:MAG: uroporphyrinogen decarboxylase family protein [bacterium]